MANATIDTLQIPVSELKGIGPRKAAVLQDAGVASIADLFYYFPRRYLDRSHITRIKDLREDELVTVVGKAQFFGIKQGRRKRFVLVLFDGTGYLNCVWFNSAHYWARVFKKDETLAVSGKVGRFGQDFQMVHPDFDRLGEGSDKDFLNTGRIIPLYPSSEALGKVGMDSRGFRRAMKQAIAAYSRGLQEILPQDLLDRRELPGLRTAIEQVHFPDDRPSLAAARKRLKFDELFYLELMLAYRKKRFAAERPGIGFMKVGERTRRLIESLPYELTAAQKRVLREIREDMKSPRTMNRLVQGDVGSGKTIVALIAIMMAIENGYQSALMAPTEILAEQHYISIRQLLEGLGIHVALLVGAQSSKEREAVLASIESGDAPIIVGTHALIQAGVEYHRLGLAIIDEQHRFGVVQRAALQQKGTWPDVLVMTATPIPRTLSLTLYGDLDVSIIDELPPGRQPVKTAWRSDRRRNDIYQFVKQHIAGGEQAYIVFPLIEESEKVDLQAALDNYEKLKNDFFRDYEVGLLHGRMTSSEKEAVMAAFKSGKIHVLVSTTVVEVGVDVPNATIMVVENAERFGLPQLHQLRGRVGRGRKASFCFLIAKFPISAEARTRLDTMAATNDGFRIAEVDLKLRGPGEFFGTRQSGMPQLRIADIVRDSELLLQAREDAFELAKQPPKGMTLKGLTLRTHFFKNYREKFELSRVG